MTCSYVDSCCIYTAHLNILAEVQRFESSAQLIRFCDGIIFDFYTGLPHYKCTLYEELPGELSEKLEKPKLIT